MMLDRGLCFDGIVYQMQLQLLVIYIYGLVKKFGDCVLFFIVVVYCC